MAILYVKGSTVRYVEDEALSAFLKKNGTAEITKQDGIICDYVVNANDYVKIK